MPVGKVNRDKVRTVAARERELKDSDIPFFILRDGKNKIRILPPPPDSDVVFVKSATHWNVGPENHRFHAPLDDKGRVTGWLHAKAAELYKSKKKEDIKLAEQIRAKKQWLYNIV